MDVEAVGFVHLEYPKAAQFRPAPFDKRQKVVPSSSCVLHAKNVPKGQRPHEERLLPQGLRREEIRCFGLFHSDLWSCLLIDKVMAAGPPCGGPNGS